IVQAGDHDFPATIDDGAAAVAQEREAGVLDHLRAPGTRDAVPIVVVSPDEKFPVARAQRAEEGLQVARAIPSSDEVPREYDDVDGASFSIADRPDMDVAEVHEGQVGRDRREHRKVLDRPHDLDPVRLDERGVDGGTETDKAGRVERPASRARTGRESHASQY